MSTIIILLIIGLIIFIYFKYFKMLKIPNVCMITGGVKTGKTTLAVNIVLKKYKQVLKRYRFKKFIYKIFRKDFNIEMPLLYSNIPLAIPYVKLTKEHLLRKVRFNYGSIVYISECALVADSMNFKDGFVNDSLTQFCKLFGHETKGGYLIFESQEKSDLHYAFKRATSRYFYIYDTIKVPFFIVMHVREFICSGEDTLNIFSEDAEESMKTIILSKKVWSKFDCYCYSILTDDKPLSNIIDNSCNIELKTKDILRLREFRHEKEK